MAGLFICMRLLIGSQFRIGHDVPARRVRLVLKSATAVSVAVVGLLAVHLQPYRRGEPVLIFPQPGGHSLEIRPHTQSG